MDGSDTEAVAKMIQELTRADLYQIWRKHTMRRRITFLLVMVLSLSLVACGADNSASSPQTDAIAEASIVVRDGEKLGNTEYVANLIQETVGGDLFRIETVEEYPLDHDPLVDQAADEQEGGTHSGEYAIEYFYNGLCWIWQP